MIKKYKNMEEGVMVVATLRNDSIIVHHQRYTFKLWERVMMMRRKELNNNIS
jgi:hypothetical protein